MGVLVERSTGDLIPADDNNFVKDYLVDAEEVINTAALQISGTEIISSTRNVKPVKIISPDSGGILFYASDGVTLIARLDDSGSLGIKGHSYKL